MKISSSFNKKKIKGKKILKNGTIGAYVYYKNEKNGNGDLLVELIINQEDIKLRLKKI